MTGNVRGAIQADPSRPSIANMAFELQCAIFEAALEPQIFFVRVNNDVLTFDRPADKVLGQACRLSREIYCKGKTLRKFGNELHWVDPERDIFYLCKDDPIPMLPRPNARENRPPRGDKFDQHVVQNVAVDLQYLGSHPQHDPIVRIWTIFPRLRRIHILVPNGPPQTPALRSTPETLVLFDIPSVQVVAAPGHDRELWGAVRYQVKRTCTKILESENGWQGRCSNPEVVGHLTGLRWPLPEQSRRR